MHLMFRFLLIILFCSASSGCAIMHVSENIPYGVLNNEDLETVEAGLPTYLLLLDGLLETYPKSKSLLIAASSLNSAYAGIFIKEEERSKQMTRKALDLSLRALYAHNKKARGIKKMKFSEFEAVIRKMRNKKKDVPVLYSVGTAWASYIQLNSSDWNVVADLAKVSYIMEHISNLDIAYENGMIPLYLGVLNSLLPPALGGKPDVAKKHFEQGIELSDGKNLIIKVMYAKQYAKLVFDRELHDTLLNEVLNTDPHEHGLTLSNVFARNEAKRLLKEADEYF